MHCIKKKRSFKGFTFIELILAASLTAIIGLTIYATLGQAVKVWVRLTPSKGVEDAQIFMEKFVQDVRNARQGEGGNFFGTKDELSFFTSVDSFSENPAFRFNLGDTAYQFSEDAGTVSVSRRNYSQAYEQRDLPPTSTLSGLKNVTFSYYGFDPDEEQYSWQEEWVKKGYPIAVRIILEWVDGGKLMKLSRTATFGWELVP